ncbi:MAG: non-ribosomal peptide synthase/polyketide synthase [Halanaerobiales bacterium]|nr:non-ribosomal peptide synthase/polyketide synthase [Halanaerobiales bacterium]
MKKVRKLEKKEIENILSLTPMQGGIFFHYLESPDSDQYFEQLALSLSGRVEEHIFKEAWNFVVKSNEMLRTCFRWEKLDQPVQIVLKGHQPLIRVRSITPGLNLERDAVIQQILLEDREEKFDLREVPFRITLCRFCQGGDAIILTNHHILFDGWSTGIIMKEFMNAYNRLSFRDDLVIPNKEKITTYLKWLKKKDQHESENYWRKLLQGFETKTGISSNKKPGKVSHVVSCYTYKLEEKLSKKVGSFVKDENITLASLIYTNWGILLQKYNNVNDSVFGITVSGRNADIPGIEQMVGLFINTIPFRIKMIANQSFTNLLQSVRQSLLEKEQFESTPLVEIQGLSEVKGQLFDSIMVFENYPIDHILKDQQSILGIDDYLIFEQTNFDLTVTINDLVGGEEPIVLNFIYKQDLFSEEDIEKICYRFILLLSKIVNNPKAAIDSVNLLNPIESETLIYRFNDSVKDYPDQKTIRGIFEERAKENSEQTALVFQNQTLSYDMLNEKANQFARYLRSKGIGLGEIIGIMVERSFEMVIGILGILKTGAAYLPIDPHYPEQRIEYILKDSQARLLVTDDKNKDRAWCGIETISLMDQGSYCENGLNLDVKVPSSELAYIIYTSGSTGRPKGVMVEHRSVVNTLSGLETKYPLLETDSYLLKTSFTFDVSVTELFGWFFGRGRLVILEPEVEKDPKGILTIIQKYSITHINFVPSMLKIFISIISKNIKYNKLKYIFSAGEAMTPDLVTTIREKFVNIQLENLYGPTEATIYATGYSSQDFAKEVQMVPIGKPLQNTQIYILDFNNQNQPIGIAGELCISGVGLARGYLNQPELTAQKFIPNPIKPGSRLYKTGDLARWLPDGNIEFLGRIDNQVKIRGYRIELGEVESILSSYPQIQQAIVVSQKEEMGSYYLCAYVTSVERIDQSDLRSYLSQHLPKHMIPSNFIQLDQMPLTTSGKIDRKALPKSEVSQKLAERMIAPETVLELKLAQIWKDVLGLQQVGIDQLFMELGGHSLKAITMTSRIEKELNIKLSIKEFFAHETIRKLSKYVASLEKRKYTPIEPIVEAEYYPTSSAQKRMYTLNQLDDFGVNYNMTQVFEFNGDLDTKLLESAFQKLIERHESFRTSFTLVDGEPVQKIQENIDFRIDLYDVQSTQKDEVESLIQKCIRPFDLSRAPLVRVSLIKGTIDQHILVVDLHHIIADGLSVQIMIDEIMSFYQIRELSKVKIQYKDFAKWQIDLFELDMLKSQEEYWLQRFADEVPILELPTDFARPPLLTFAGDRIYFDLAKNFGDKINQLARDTDTTPYMVLLATFAVLLGRYTGQEDIVIGSPIAGRNHADVEQVIGLFVNTLALRNYVNPEETFTEFLTQVKNNVLEAFENQDYPLERMIEKLEIKRALNRNPLFDVVFNMQTMDSRNLTLGNVTIEPFELKRKISKFDLTMQVIQTREGLNFEIEYSTELFKEATINRLCGHFLQLLSQIVKRQDQKTGTIVMISEEEKDQLLHKFNQTQIEYPKDTTIQQLFEEQVIKIPEQVAVVFENQQLTYRELNKGANQLARTLRQKGVGSDQIVGIMAERSLTMIIGVLAIIKAGGAYLPIDIDYPQNRIQYMLEDSDTNVLLTTGEMEIDFAGEKINLEDRELYQGDDSNLPCYNKTCDLIYVIYTSGSTGRPKGVMIEHQNVNRLISNSNMLLIESSDRIMQTGALAFDASTFEIWGALLNGSSLYLISKLDLLSPEQFKRRLQEYQITIIWLTAPLFNQLVEDDIEIFAGLYTLIVGGDALSPKHIYRVKEAYPEIKIINGYGPTESTTFTTYYVIKEVYEDNIPIGYPVSNTKVYILSRGNQLQPVGVPGELCIAGDGLARGYLKRPDLTAEKFVEDPFIPGKKMYRSGDLARWSFDGKIQFLGRIDQQVKIRGFRIELGEIENELMKYPEIREAVVLDKKDDRDMKYLCAYFVANLILEKVEIRRFLTDKLPAYMVPSFFIQVEKMPLTSNGKFNRKALPEPVEVLEESETYIAPINEQEENLAQIWCEVLGMDQVGREDDFFELGGHSLKATRLVSRISKEFNVSFLLRDVFKYPILWKQVEYIKKAQKVDSIKIEQVEEKEYYPVSSAQKRMYMLSQFEKNGISYNIPAAIVIEGNLDQECFMMVFDKLIERHESLRTSFNLIEGEPVQVIHEKVDLRIELLEINEKDIHNTIHSLLKPFDLRKAPLFRIALLQISKTKHLLFFDMHHIISDGTSMGILVKEFAELYEGQKLPEIRVQYKDYATWQHQKMENSQMTIEEEYWLDHLAGDEIPVLDLSTDWPRPLVQSFVGQTIPFTLDKEVDSGIHKLMNETETTKFMVLLAAFNILLFKYTGQVDFIVGTPIAGRENKDLENIIGMFVNTLALRNHIQKNRSINAFLGQVKEVALNAFDHQNYPLEELIEKLDIKRDLSRNPLFDVMFTMQNMEILKLKIRDLKISPYTVEYPISKFDLSLYAEEEQNQLCFRLEYCTELFKRETMEQMIIHFKNILREIISNPTKLIKDIEMISQKEKEQILFTFNQTLNPYPEEKLIHDFFEERVEEIPDQVAIVYQERELTYRQLNQKVNCLAHLLRISGVGPEEIVGIMVYPSIEMIIGILAILKAGGAYLPIHPNHPVERIQYMLDDSKTGILLTHFEFVEKWSENLFVINLENEAIFTDLPSNLERMTKSENIAYIIYTSGSTGTPKGVLIQHQSAVNILTALEKEYPLTNTDSYLLKTTYTFDVSVTELFGWFFGKGRLVILEKDAEKDPKSILQVIEQYHVTHINFVPAMLQMLVYSLNEHGWRILSNLKYILVAGEAFSGELAETMKKNTKNVFVDNLYGPTEGTIYTTSYSLADWKEGSVPIGRPLCNIQVYVLGSEDQLQPIGVPGELCIAGVGLARGYLNRHDLTSVKFVPNPFNIKEKIYRSGDLVKWNSDGTIQFMGRIDQQVKIRGFRIELGEIESQLLNEERIHEALVMDRKDDTGNTYLCAYLVGIEKLAINELRQYLSRKLPEYMIPDYFVQLDQMPLNQSGKIDRKALPEPSGRIYTGNSYIAPGNELEERLAQIWSEILNIEKPGVEDHFFALGGHSLKATQLVTKVHEEFEVELSIRDVFLHPTIRKLSGCIQSVDKSVYESIKRIEERAFYPVSSAQERIFTLSQLEKDEVHYNMPIVFRLKGNLNISQCEVALKSLVQRHETLRTSFEFVNGELMQKVSPEVDFTLKIIEESEKELSEIIQTFIVPFDLIRAPLFRTVLIKRSSDEYIIVMDLHHAIADGTSLGILMSDFLALYQRSELPTLVIQYRDYVVWQNDIMLSDRMTGEETYWLNQLSGELPILNLPTDALRPLLQSFVGDQFDFILDTNLTKQVKLFAEKTESTLFMILLATYNLLLYKYTGQRDLLIGTPIAGRQHADLEKILGMFVNTLVMRTEIRPEETSLDYLARVKDNTLAAYEHQNYPFERLVEKLNPPRDLGRNPLFDVMFSMQNMDLPTITLKNLQVEPYPLQSKVSKFDLSLFAMEIQEDIHFTFEYSSRLFKKETIQQMANHFISLLKNMIIRPDLPVLEIPMISSEECHYLLVELNNTQMNYREDVTVHQLFAEQVEKTPDHIAVVYQDQHLTYSELNCQANQVAHRLREGVIESDHIVGLMVNRSLEMVIGMLAILKAGGAYLPLDPDYPEERIQYMIEDSQVKWILTQNHLKDRLPGKVNLIDLTDQNIYTGNGENPVEIAKPENLIYLIYTSGSTGKPKGVMLEHRNLSNLLQFEFDQTNIDFSKGTLQFASMSFDVSFQEIFSTLLAGGILYLIPQELRNEPVHLLQFLAEKEIENLFLPVAYVKFIFSEEEYWRVMPSTVKHIITAGEQLIVNERFREYLQKNDVYLHNHYGPSEAHVVSTLTLSPDDEIPDLPTIGRPIANTQIYILDFRNKPQPIGVPGELCIGGHNVGRGYLNRPELSKEKFVENPYRTGGRMYRTGDLARWLRDGTIEFLGRIDNQVKIRGFRVELGEIESQLLKVPRIKETVVTVHSDDQGNHDLCAYLVTDLSIERIRKELVQKIPEYMIPSNFVLLEEMPLTPSGKINRRVLPKPEVCKDSGHKYIAPTNLVEEGLTKLWTEILGIEPIGIDDHFFVLGGHSLKATRLVSRIEKEWAVKLSLKQIFQNPTIRALAECIQKEERWIYQSIERVEKREMYPTSFAQKRIFTLSQIVGQGSVYNMPFVVKFLGNLNIHQLQSALFQLVQRHESLRTGFQFVKGELVQTIHDSCDPMFEVLTMDDTSKEAIEEKVQALIQPFDLTNPPLLRAYLMKLTDDEYILLLDMHHIISDGVSMGILIQDLMALYEGNTLQELRIQYRDYAVWQNKQMESEQYKNEQEYWLNQFIDELPVLDLPTDYSRPRIQSFKGNTVHFEVEPQWIEKLRQLSESTETTFFMCLLAVYNILLFRYTGQNDLIIGTPIAGRSHADLENIIGMFVNTLALRNQVYVAESGRELIQRIKANSLKAFANQNYLFEELVEKLEIERNLGRNPLFDALFAMQNMEIPEMQMKDFTVLPYSFKHTISKFDLALYVSEEGDRLHFVIEYCTELFKEETIQRMSGHFCKILYQIAENPDQKIRTIVLVSDKEREELLYKFNQTEFEYPSEKTIQQLFEEQVEKTPDQVALVYEDQQLTYCALNQRANLLARVLRQKGVIRDQVVGIMAERSLEMIVGVLAIIKAGGAYLPIEVDYPENRVQYMLEDSETQLLLATKEVEVEFEGEIINLEDAKLYCGDDSNLTIQNQNDDLIYIIYTSGSTGQPKGVMIQHKNVNRLISNSNMLIIGNQDRIMQTGSLAFDASTFEIWGALLNGASLHLISKSNLLSPERFKERLHGYQITMIWLTAPLFNQLVDEDIEIFARLHTLIVGGDALSPKHICKVREVYPEIKVINGYGPTESTTFTTYFVIEESYEENIPIGYPVSNTKVYILNRENQLQPVGVLGELCIAGDGLARGYLKRPELTVEKFVADPFNPGKKIYRTGDLVRWSKDGQIQFLGRIDHQVKIRGFRIELGEIETELLKYPEIKEVAVLDKINEIGMKYLCAYIASDQNLQTKEIRRYLKERLPSYMVPSYFVQLAKMPLTSNGKINRKALPEPVRMLEENINYVAPINEQEDKLAQIWSDILGVDKVGREDDFFELGGHSLKATQLVSRILKEFEVSLPLHDVFKYPILREQMIYLLNAQKAEYIEIPKVQERDYYPVSSAQKNLMVYQQLLGDTTNYNIPVVMEVKGSLNFERLTESFSILVERHESLRTSFDWINNEPIQMIHQKLDFHVEHLKVKDEQVEDLIREFVKPFQLNKPPLMRVAFIETKERQFLAFDMHHIISDGTSMKVLIQELSKLYYDGELPALTLQFKDYALWQNERLNSGALKQQESFWLNEFKNLPLPLNLPNDYERPKEKSTRGGLIEFELDGAITEVMKKLARENDATLFMVVLAAYSIFLSKYGDREDVIIGSPIAGRLHPELEKVIGMFINTLPLRTRPMAGQTFTEFLQEIRSNTLKAYENQEFQYERMVEMLKIETTSGRNPLFDVMLVFQNFGMPEVKTKEYTLIPYWNEDQTSKFDLTLYAGEVENKIQFAFRYSTDLFKKATVERFADELLFMLEKALTNPTVRVGELRRSMVEEENVFNLLAASLEEEF